MNTQNAFKNLSLILFILWVQSLCVSVKASVLSIEKSESLMQMDDKSFDLNALRDQKAVVLVAHGSSCPVMRQNYPAFKDLATAFKKNSVQFIFINPLTTDNKQRLNQEIAQYHLSSEIFLTEKSQKTLVAAGLRTVGQAAVLVPREENQWEIVFRGGISDRVNFDRASERPKRKYLEAALTDVLNNRKVRTAEAPTFGCSISGP